MKPRWGRVAEVPSGSKPAHDPLFIRRVAGVEQKLADGPRCCCLRITTTTESSVIASDLLK